MAPKFLSFQIETGITPNTTAYDVIRFITDEEGIKYVATPVAPSQTGSFEINIGRNQNGSYQPAFNIITSPDDDEYSRVCHAIKNHFKLKLKSDQGWYDPEF